MLPFQERLHGAVSRTAPVCVGLDPHLDRLPRPLRERFEGKSGEARRIAAAEAVAEWCATVIEVVANRVPAIKPQLAFFEQLGAAGWAVLEVTVQVARRRGLLVVLDAKRGDIGSTAEGYAHALLDDDGPLGADALTVHPYLGQDSLAPFVERCRAGKGLFVLLRTSNPGGTALQQGAVAERVSGWLRDWNDELASATGYGPVGAVIGATLNDEVAHWRAALPRTWFLVPGYGAQGATAEDCRACLDPQGYGALVNSSRGVTSASAADRDEYDAQPAVVIRRQLDALLADFRRET
jgi:orotidine-5'-phosphate decarboxylase